jgi:outer membrane protein TolC
MKAAVLVAVVLAAAPGVGAQAPQAPAPPAMPTIEFEAAIQRALEKNPTIAEAATTISRAEALLEQARAVTMPNISAALSSTTLNTGVSFNGLVAQPRTQVTISATAAVPVLAAANWAAVAQSRDQITVSKLSVAETRQQVAVAAAQAYLAVIAAKRQVDVEQRALENAQAHFDYAQKRLQGGVGSRLDQVRAAQVVSSEQALLENSRLALLTAQEALGVLLVEDGPVDAGAEPTFDVPSTIDESSWMGNRPDVQYQNASIQAAERVVHDSWKDWLPTGTASFTPQEITPTSVFQKSRSWRFTVSFSQPIFEGGQRKAEATLRRITLDQSHIQLTAIQIQARSEVRLAQASLQSYERALASARQAADQANQVLSITTSAFQLGATTNLEVIDAERSARDAATTAALAEDSVRRARLDLLVALGRFPR